MTEDEQRERFKRIRRELSDAVAGVLQRHGEMLTKWIVLAEGIGAEDNERGLWMATAEGATAWDSLGMLMHAIQREQASVTAEAVQDG